ncbi:MAG: aminotransferase class V-fold PLP-dependent enzyme [Lachnospirales bacterium]
MIYLDNASTSFRRPQYVKENMIKALDEFTNPNRGSYKSSYASGLAVFGTRIMLGKFFNSKPENIIFTQNATTSLNHCIFNLCTSKSKVITTNIDHNAVIRPLKHIGCETVVIDVLGDTKEILQNLENEIANTDLFVCTHASNVIGKTLPIKEMAAICKNNNVKFVLDIAQSGGMLRCDIKDLGVDIMCFTGHKSLYGPTGIGGIVLSEEFLENNPNLFKPFIHGGNGIDTFNQDNRIIYPDSFDSGTLNLVGIYGLNGGVKYINEVGLEKIYFKAFGLAKSFYEEVKCIPNVKVYEGIKPRYTPVVSLNIGDVSSIDVSEILYDEFDVATRPGFHCAPYIHKAFGTTSQGMVRFSFSGFNTEKEVDVALEGVSHVAKKVK